MKFHLKRWLRDKEEIIQDNLIIPKVVTFLQRTGPITISINGADLDAPHRSRFTTSLSQCKGDRVAVFNSNPFNAPALR